MTSVLVIGGGGREHALAWKLEQSSKVQRVYIAPGNAADFPSADVSPSNPHTVANFCQNENVKLVVVGPEAPLSEGFVDKIRDLNIPVFGPPQAAAQLESSKIYAKLFMREFGLPTADFDHFNSIEEAHAFIDRCAWKTIVVKADGLAAGKGVVVASSIEEAKEAATSMLKGQFGSSSTQIVIEEGLVGYEVSALCFTDGRTFRRMPLIRDHKRLLEGDQGANTGGMGVVGPVEVPAEVDTEIDRILQKTLDSLRFRNILYTGVLYAGFMVTNEGPKLLEYNCRFGDPETEILMRLLQTDLYDICCSCINGKLATIEPKWSSDKACGIILAAKNYPASGDKGTPITGLGTMNDSVVVFHCGTARKDDNVVTNGGRVLCVTATAPSLREARNTAVLASEKINFDGKQFRRDIGAGVETEKLAYLSYGDSGVDINEGNTFVNDIKGLVKSTLKPGTSQIGGFGAVIDFGEAGYKPGVQIVVGIDGVGTKIEIADAVGDFSTVGCDVVAMCVNDVLCHGAAPIAFLDYYVCGKLERNKATQVVRSIANACIESGCSLVGGETAEMPGVYGAKQWDLAGCAIAARERDWPLLPATTSMVEGDVLIGLPSSGVHSNGFSLVRKILAVNNVKYSDPTPWDSSKRFGEVLLRPTRLYVKSVLPLIRKGEVKGCAHITGGGITENAIRVLDPKGNLQMEVDAASWEKQPLFNWLANSGPVSDVEMLKTFNCGIGMVLVTSSAVADSVISSLKAAGEAPVVIGELCARSGDSLISYKNLSSAFSRSSALSRRKIKVAILISGTGSNMMRLIERSKKPGSNCEVVKVISNKADAGGLKRAQEMGISTDVVPHTKVREEGDRVISKILKNAGVEMICLGGYMRLLSPEFVQTWRDRIINIHPSLLPSFKGAHAVRDAIEFGAKITGCTVHIVDELVDHGPIVAQAAIPIEDDDTEDSLHRKIQVAEHNLFPEAMEKFANKLLKNC